MNYKTRISIVMIIIVFFTASIPLFSQVYGRLEVKNGGLYGRGVGRYVQLKGMSSHGLQWFPWCSTTVKYLARDWNCTVVRAAMYTKEGGYIDDPSVKYEVEKIVEAAIYNGIYVIIDWHVLNDHDPNIYKYEARAFFKEMAIKYGEYNHVIYEICNEPNGVTWSQIKDYADFVIPTIRYYDPDSVIICGTSTWNQDVDIAANDPLNYGNIVYALHFYSGTHGQALRDKADVAIGKGLPIFVSEWGTSDCMGSGGPYLTEADRWISWMGERGISWCNWSLCNKAESSAALNPGVSICGPWYSSDLSTSGSYIKSRIGEVSATMAPTPTPYSTPVPQGDNIAEDDFSSGTTSGGYGWSGSWTIGVEAGGAFSHDFHTSHYTSSPYSLNLEGDTYASREVNLSGASGVTLSFTYRLYGLESGDVAKVRIHDGSWKTLLEWTYGDDDGNWHSVTLDLSGLNMTSGFVVCFDADFSSTKDYFYFDDVVIREGESSSTPAPTATPAYTPAPTNPPSGYSIAQDDFSSGGLSGGSGWSGNWSIGAEAGGVLSYDFHTLHYTSAPYSLNLEGDTYASRPVNLADASGVTLSFNYRLYSLETGDVAKVRIFDGSWKTLKEWTVGDDDGNWHSVTLDLSGLNMTSGFVVCFDADFSSTKDYFYIDNVVITGGGA